MKGHTPADALILTPSGESGFRIFSERSIVGEWRDGTQLYFNAKFAGEWWDRMNTLQPGLVLDAEKKGLISGGKGLDLLSDDQIIEIARKYKAGYVVLPGGEHDRRTLMKKYANAEWTIYEPKLDDAGMLGGDAGLKDDDKFIQENVFVNIEKYRKSDAHVVIVDAADRPVAGAAVKLTQTSSPFGFGATLPFFKVPGVDVKADYKPPQVTKMELDAFSAGVQLFGGVIQRGLAVSGAQGRADGF